uniref:Poly [ADP-ribose] polymerase n=1 Tax=Ciona intestinalis TaxID=7719 RepID=F6YBZ2_CIOIN
TPVTRTLQEKMYQAYDFQFGQVVVQLVAGDIVKQECDVIVNSVDSSYNLNLGKISASIYKHVDKQVQQECHQNRIDGCDYFRLTSAGSLPCKWILHFVVPDDLQEMSDSFLQLLQYADSDALQAKTIAVPCLGMGNQRKKLESVILFFRDSIQCFTCFGSVKCIQYIKIIIQFVKLLYHAVKKNHATTKILTNLPKTWDLTGKPKYLNFVNPQSEEFKAIENRLATAVPTISDIKIERVQNESLYRLYSVKKQEVLLHLQSDRVAEMDLYHGSPNYETIAGTYFNRGYAGATGTLYGKGTYFATELQTAMKHCDRQDGYYTVILATVLTGNYTKGYGNMRDAGVNKDGVLYDSSVDNESNPKFFVVYHDASAYPKYVVTFT